MFQKRVDLSFLSEFELLTFTKILEMALDQAKNEEEKKPMLKAIRHLKKPRRCTPDDLACINAAVNGFLDWYEETPLPIAEMAFRCVQSAVNKISEKTDKAQKEE